MDFDFFMLSASEKPQSYEKYLNIFIAFKLQYVNIS